MIGIAITTHNRRDTALQTFDKWTSMLPDGAIIIVVDDASDEPYPNADYRFDLNVGIAKAKNKCIELLIERGCDELFLADFILHSEHSKTGLVQILKGSKLSESPIVGFRP